MVSVVLPTGRKGEKMNSVNIIGRLVRDPEVKRTEDGRTICNLRIAIDDTFSKEDRADFINVTVFGSQANVCDRYLRKGFIAGVSGHIRSETYTDSEGAKRYPVKLIAERVQILQWPERKDNRAGVTAPTENSVSVQAENTEQEFTAEQECTTNQVYDTDQEYPKVPEYFSTQEYNTGAV
jgi:single-strand DNA-binding protein